MLSTFPTAEAAADVARVLVEERLAACVNVLPPIRSIYRWEGQVRDEPEVLAVIKTTADRFGELQDRLVELHPYEVPEIVALQATDANLAYVQWVTGETQTPAPSPG